ncbi:MAG TPA: alpha/beta hydrolase-fold protein [Acidobacteriaceae bacterium]|jgi:enterochelin esterase family protein|nr:alpha/beta hydrolase-fold protein [Acidobacteriaceae bacterium]
MYRALMLAPLFLSLPLAAQTLNSHQVNPDGSITFRYQNPGATTVTVDTDAAAQPLAMQRGDKGMWSVTTPSLPPEYYSYTFVVDDVPQLDPVNHAVIPNLVGLADSVLVPGQPPKPWELTAIPHGDVTRYVYTTHIAKNLPENQEAYLVYTPPGYDAHRKGGYPVLYLLHGWSDAETGWMEVGRANLILDSMLVERKIVPMIVVMPLGYGNFHFVTGTYDDAWNYPTRIQENVALFSHMLLDEIIPAVERDYNIAPGREDHAIAGLSMGGLESLTVGLHHSDEFAWVGAFSAALEHHNFNENIPGFTSRQANLRLLWIACGTGDAIHIGPTRELVSWAKGEGLPVVGTETTGGHAWLVWRDNLLQFAPLLFR